MDIDIVSALVATQPLYESAAKPVAVGDIALRGLAEPVTVFSIGAESAALQRPLM